MAKIVISFFILILTFISAQDLSGQWQKCEGPYGGIIYSIIEKDNILFVTTQNGVYRSLDDGLTWNSSGLSWVESYSMAVSGNNLYVASFFSGIYHSDDNGLTWNNIQDTLNITRIPSIVCIDHNLFVCTYNGDLYHTSDNGKSWNKRNDGISEFTINFLKTRGNKLYACTNGDGLFESSDYGESWEPINNGLPKATIRVLEFGEQRSFISTVGGMFYTDDFGQNWIKCGYGMPSNLTISLAILNNKIISGNFYGLYESEDNGMNWNLQKNSLESQRIRELYLTDSKLFAGTVWNGIFRADNSGMNWESCSDGIDLFRINDIHRAGKYIYAATEHGGFYKSSDEGFRWETINNGLTSFWATSLTSNSEYLFGSTRSRVYYSNDEGQNWIPFEGTYPSYGLKNIVAFDNKLFLAVSGQGVLCTEDLGGNWVKSNQGLSNFNINELKSNGNTLILSTSSGLFMLDNANQWIEISGDLPSSNISEFDCKDEIIVVRSGFHDIYRSLDLGSTWELITEGLPYSALLRTVEIENNNIVISVNTGSIFVSNDLGDTWESTDFPIQKQVGELLIDQNFILAASERNGIYRIRKEDYITSVYPYKSQASEFSLKQNYPNPFNPSTNINYSLPIDSRVSFKLFDALGRYVKTFLDKNKLAGEYSLKMDFSSLPSGIYFGKLEIEGYSKTIKMIFLK